MAWEKATRFLTVILGVSKILWWMFFSADFIHKSNIHICKYIDTTCTTVCIFHTIYIFHFQCQPVDEWPLLREFHVELGDGWICRYVHGITICYGGCTAYVSTAAKKNLQPNKSSLTWRSTSQIIRIHYTLMW